MRNAIKDPIGSQTARHFGLSYDVLAPSPLGPDKPDIAERNKWLDRCERISIPDDYRFFFARWKRSFSTSARTQEVTAKSRILVGHGNPSGADVGLTVHHTWGVPVLPGSALKGLAAHYADIACGEGGPPGHDPRDWRGPTWTDGRVRTDDGPGQHYAALFGSPAVEGKEKSERRGCVEFHDALYVPVGPSKPFARDVLTVHQKEYYDSQGREAPNDWTSPVPVGFLTVRPKTRFLLALTGPRDWTDLAMRLLLAALAEWGIGGKTSAGYGRLG